MTFVFHFFLFKLNVWIKLTIYLYWLTCNLFISLHSCSAAVLFSECCPRYTIKKKYTYILKDKM